MQRMAKGVTHHLAPEDVWQAQQQLGAYRPEGFEAEAFVHCTDGESMVLEVGNRYYRDDPRPFVLLDVDLDLVRSRAIYEDAEGRYPHVYGPIDREAVVRVRRVERDGEGSFVGIGGDVET